MKKKKDIQFIDKAILPTSYGTFQVYGFLEKGGKEHLALVKGTGDLDGSYVRIHSKCQTGDALYSLRCDCGEQLERALAFLGKQKKGILIYLDQEGRGIGLINKIKSYHLQDKGLDTYEANVKLGFLPDERNYAPAIEILKFLKIKRIKLITNNPDKIYQLEKQGITIIKRIALGTEVNIYNKSYLKTKLNKFNHLLKI